METIGSPALWAGFLLFVLAMLALDLGVFHRKEHEIKFREAAIWSCVWVAISVLFGIGVYFFFGEQPALQFFTGYLIEKALSVDNIFVMLVIFSSFGVPQAYRHKALAWGILGALLMRAVFILAGAALIQRFSWVMYVFGVLLIYTGAKMFFEGDAEPHPEKNRAFRLFQKMVPTTSKYHGSHFFVVENGRKLATPLLAVVVLIEITDLIFAVDSIPAIFAITTDPFIVFTSNIFAILGLRAMFFLLSGVMGKFHFLKIGLAFVLLFVGGKMLTVHWFHMPVEWSLIVIAVILAGAIGASLIWPAKTKEEVPAGTVPPDETQPPAKH